MATYIRYGEVDGAFSFYSKKVKLLLKMENRYFLVFVLLSSVLVASGQVVLNCNYDHLSVNGAVGYGCDLKNVRVDRETDRIIVMGDHQPGMTNNDVVRLTIMNSQTGFIITQLFTQFPNLHQLEISNGGLQRIQPNAFVLARNLRSLVIQGNNLIVLQANSFNHMMVLDTLILRSNNIQLMDANTFVGLTSLRYLFINNEGIRMIQPNTFRPLTSLVMLSLGSNHIERVDAEMLVNNRQLHSVFLENNNINAIQPTIINNINSIQILSLSSNPCINHVIIPRAASSDDINEMLNKCYANWH
ncbi:unnamed protein product [Chironomus riparius]|uniref:Uncharacterized protein n=1 Tax=Chironomus riparius TaxID=315576 RepID=A0A9N9RXS5_9DIPT|nr:unnamed protein product [Chironomus riparius]